MKTEVEIRPEIEVRLIELETELRKVATDQLAEDELSALTGHLQALAIRFHDAQAAKEAFWQPEDITGKLGRAEDLVLELLKTLDPGVQQVITYAVRRTQLPGLTREEQDRQITRDLDRETAQGAHPYVHTLVHEHLDQLMQGIQAAREERRSGGRPKEELLADLAVRVGAELNSVGITPTSTGYGTFDSVFRAVLSAAGLRLPALVKASRRNLDGDARRYLNKAITELKKRGKL